MLVTHPSSEDRPSSASPAPLSPLPVASSAWPSSGVAILPPPGCYQPPASKPESSHSRFLIHHRSILHARIAPCRWRRQCLRDTPQLPAPRLLWAARIRGGEVGSATAECWTHNKGKGKPRAGRQLAARMPLPPFIFHTIHTPIFTSSDRARGRQGRALLKPR